MNTSDASNGTDNIKLETRLATNQADNSEPTDELGSNGPVRNKGPIRPSDEHDTVEDGPADDSDAEAEGLLRPERVDTSEDVQKPPPPPPLNATATGHARTVAARMFGRMSSTQRRVLIREMLVEVRARFQPRRRTVSNALIR